MHWACTKITTSSAIADASLLEMLLDKACILCFNCLTIINPTTSFMFSVNNCLK